MPRSVWLPNHFQELGVRTQTTSVGGWTTGLASLASLPAVHVRPATVEDASAILEIYNREVLETTATFDLVPRTLEDQVDYIRQRSGGLAVIVVEDDEGIVTGFGSLSFYRDRPAYRTSVENSVYVHRDHRRRGVGDLILAALIELARNHGFHAMLARIAEAQEASVALHERHGFELVGIEKEVGRKFNQWRDCALMQRLI